MFAQCALAVSLLVCGRASQAQVPGGIGMFMTDTRQARWQMDNYRKPAEQWQGNQYNPPCCIGPNCDPCPCEGEGQCVDEYPQSSLADTVQFLKNQGVAYTIVKIGEGTKVSPQVNSKETTAAFATAGMPVFGYHKLSSQPGDAQATAVLSAFQTWPALSGLVIMPGDDYYDLFANDAGDQARQIALDYVQVLRRAKVAGGALAGKVVLYAPESANDPAREPAHIILGVPPLTDATMPRTFWLKNTPYGPAEDPFKELYARESQLRGVWGLTDPPAQARWWTGRPIVLWAQTDMMAQQGRSRIQQFVDRVRQETLENLGRSTTPKYRLLSGMVIWEWAHMNRNEIDAIPGIAQKQW